MARSEDPAQMWGPVTLKLRFHGHKIVGGVCPCSHQPRPKGKDWLMIRKKDFAVREG